MHTDNFAVKFRYIGIKNPETTFAEIRVKAHEKDIITSCLIFHLTGKVETFALKIWFSYVY
jgi:hypothetical protein